MTKQQQEAIAPLPTAQQWLALGEEAQKSGLVYLLLTGGEPFLRPDLRQILSGLNRLGLLVSINTNATLIDETVIQWLKQTPPCRVNVTLYGACDATYHRLCGNPQGYTQAVRGIRLLKQAGISVRINCSVTAYNTADLEGIFAFARQEGLPVQASSYMFPPLRRASGMVGRNDRLSPEEAARQSARLMLLQYGKEEYLRRVSSLSLPGELGEECPDLPAEGEKLRCRAGKCSFWVTWEGKIQPCGMFSGIEAPNVFRESFSAAWEQVKQTAAAIRTAPKCGKCPLRAQCKPCAAMALTETGHFGGVPEYRCEMTHAFTEASRCLASQLSHSHPGGGAF
jgi:radical SAM protein with 4Fe4S-binding SPASM domain